MADGTPTIQEQAPVLLAQVAGYVGHRTIAMGLRQGLIRSLAQHEAGISAESLATQLGLDPFYVTVWCRSALAAGVCERDGDGYRLSPHMATLLLDAGSPAYVGGVFTLFEQPELFQRFESVLPTGERMWWEDTGPDWIAGVAGTGGPFYTRLVPGGLAQVPGLVERLEAGCRVVDTACGAGTGLVRLAEHYPACEIVGVDGDAHSIDIAGKRVAEAGVTDRVPLVHQPLEEMSLDEPGTLVVNNISIQFFEAQIDDQLLPRAAYDDLLARHEFSDLGSTTLTPMHALTWGRA